MAGDQETNWWSASLLGLLSPAARDALLRSGRRRVFASGEILMAQGDPPDGLAVILAGRAKIVGRDRQGHTRVLAFRGVGDVVGEIGVMDGKPRTADVVAAGQVEAVVIGADRFQDFIARYPEAQRAVTDTVIAKLRLATGRRIDLDHQPVTVRVAAALLQQAGFDGVRRGGTVTVRLTQAELAELAGASVPSIQRSLDALKDPDSDATLRQLGLGLDPLVAVAYRHIKILRPDALELLAHLKD